MSAIPESLRAQVVARAGNRCEYCKVSGEDQVGQFPLDHVVPKADRGPTTLENLAFSCWRFNASKWRFRTGVDPVTGEDVPLFNPRIQAWEDHFQWSPGNPLMIEGKTAVGRATIARLQMNHPNLILVRLHQSLFGLHLGTLGR